MMKFLSKADTLISLAPIIKSAVILPCEKVLIESWQQRADDVVHKVFNQFADVPVVVRSSSNAEDGVHSSNAGAFYSAVNILDEQQLRNAISDVFSSYPTVNYHNCHLFVQPQLTDVKISGVAFTVDMKTGSPYYVINYDDEAGDTEAVTSGKNASTHVEYWFKGDKFKKLSWRVKLVKLLQELESCFPDTPLDVEFAFDNNEQLYLFQVRPLVMTAIRDEPSVKSIEKINSQLRQVKQKIARLCERQPGIVGKYTIFANMPDWNPAEIIGVKPKPLALSLYKELVTDGVWAYQRDNYGYRNLRSFPLLVSLAHSPYIDARVSFNSFVPKIVDDSLAEKLVDYYLNKLRSTPSLQDKVEFDIVLSCYSLDINDKLDTLPNDISNVEKKALKTALFDITERVISGKNSLLEIDIEKINKLIVKQEEIDLTSLNEIEKIYWLIEDCKRYGTLPFAGIARAAFIATQLLTSLVSCGLFTQRRKDLFLNSLSTVSSEYIKDKEVLSRSEFLHKYGHLRPGTYDIESLRYDEMPAAIIFSDKSPSTELNQSKLFLLEAEESAAISSAMHKHGFTIDANQLFRFFKRAIESREWAKFVFSKSISNVLKLTQGLGQRFNIPNCALAQVDIRDVMSLYASTLPAKNVIKSSIERHQTFYQMCSLIPLPAVICPDTNITHFRLPDCLPNFITKQKTIADVVSDLEQPIRGKVVFIEAADPGYDWIFSEQIAGFITMYGGANSHMAIRANELGIPAVIGVGQKFFQLWQTYEVISLDCELHKVTKIR